jgi:hypothetical protein
MLAITGLGIVTETFGFYMKWEENKYITYLHILAVNRVMNLRVPHKAGDFLTV